MPSAPCARQGRANGAWQGWRPTEWPWEACLVHHGPSAPWACARGCRWPRAFPIPHCPPHRNFRKHTHRRVSLSLAPGSAGRRPCHLWQATPGDERWAGAKAPLARLAAPRRAEHRGRRVPGAACVPCLPRCLLKKARPKRMRLPPCRRRRRCPNQTHALVPGGHRVGRRRRLRTGRGSLIGTTCCPVPCLPRAGAGKTRGKSGGRGPVPAARWSTRWWTRR